MVNENCVNLVFFVNFGLLGALGKVRSKVCSSNSSVGERLRELGPRIFPQS